MHYIINIFKDILHRVSLLYCLILIVVDPSIHFSVGHTKQWYSHSWYSEDAGG